MKMPLHLAIPIAIFGFITFIVQWVVKLLTFQKRQDIRQWTLDKRSQLEAYVLTFMIASFFINLVLFIFILIGYLTILSNRIEDSGK